MTSQPESGRNPGPQQIFLGASLKQLTVFFIFLALSFALQISRSLVDTALKPVPVVLDAPNRSPGLPRNVYMSTQTMKALEYPPLVASPNAFALSTPILKDWALSSIGYFELGKVACGKQVTVAVIDTGIDYNHSDLQNSLWINKGETGKDQNGNAKSSNGIDDDANGFIDDVIGWDFVHDVPLPYDTHGHGTHIAGLVTSMGNAGNCDRVRIMSLKYYDNSGAGFNNLANTVRAIEYATHNGAQIINYSGGGHDPASTEKTSVKYAAKKGILFVTAAGNEGKDIAVAPYHPASYNLENMLSIGSINKNEQKLPTSNFGSSVQVFAPGLSVLSLLPQGKYGTMSGTSQATAIVSGAAALLMSQQKTPNLGALTDALRTVKKVSDLKTGGVLNLPKALKSLNGTR